MLLSRFFDHFDGESITLSSALRELEPEILSVRGQCAVRPRFRTKRRRGHAQLKQVATEAQQVRYTVQVSLPRRSSVADGKGDNDGGGEGGGGRQTDRGRR